MDESNVYNEWLNEFRQHDISEIGIEGRIDTVSTMERASQIYRQLDSNLSGYMPYTAYSDYDFSKWINGVVVRNWNQEINDILIAMAGKYEQLIAGKRQEGISEDELQSTFGDTLNFCKAFKVMQEYGRIAPPAIDFSKCEPTDIVGVFMIIMDGFAHGLENVYGIKNEELETLLFERSPKADKLRLAMGLNNGIADPKLPLIATMLSKAKQYGLREGMDIPKKFEIAQKYAAIQQASDEEIVAMCSDPGDRTPDELRKLLSSGYPEFIRNSAEQFVQDHHSKSL